MPDTWFFQLFEDPTDPHTPLFWETMAWASRQGMDLLAPDVDLPEPSIGVQVQELKRQVALKTPTMPLGVIARGGGQAASAVDQRPYVDDLRRDDAGRPGVRERS